MALGPRLDLRQTQSLVMTPQLQQAIRLLAASNLEIETFITEALESNPLLEAESFGRDEAAETVADAAPREELAADRLIAEGRGEGEQPLDLDPAALDRDFDTGDADWRQGDQGDWGQGDWGAAQSGSGMHDDMPGIEAHGG